MTAEFTHGTSKGWISCRMGNFSLEINWQTFPGQVLVLFGPSGAGKTTTLRAIAGLSQPEEGLIQIGDQTVYDSANRLWVEPHRRRVGYLTQQYHLFPHLTVRGNIAYGVTKQASNDVNGRVDNLIQRLQLDGLEFRKPWQLSGGQRQRVALARSLAPEPALLLLDEPFASLDGELRRSLRHELRSLLSQANIPVILVTHDREEALALGDTVQVISEGRTLMRGEPLEVLGQPNQGRVARLVGVENLLPMQIASRQPQDGTMICSLQSDLSPSERSLHLEVPLSDFSEGESVTVGIRASDVILATSELQGSSARNQLHSRVVEVEIRPPGYEVTLDCGGLQLRCHITGTSLAEMQVEPGQEMWAVFKASSCFLIAD